MPELSRRAALALASAAFAAPGWSLPPSRLEQWGTVEFAFPGPKTANPFLDTALSGIFECGDSVLEVPGFYDGDGIWRLRFMPTRPGSWHFRTTSNAAELDGRSARFEVAPASTNNHGPVSVANTYHFAYADGAPCWPLGTTSYAWTHQPDGQCQATLKSLAASPFNKLRFAVFPNADAAFEPLYPFPGEPHAWDYSRFNPAFFRKLDNLVVRLRDLGIEADIILFHPYDGGKWGFDAMPAEVDARYVRYLIARLSAYRNVWWSLANEYDAIKSKSEADFDRLFQVVRAADPYNHLRSIHHLARIYDNSKPWVTHASLQNGSAVEDDARAELYREVWRKPVVFDEVKYEGNLAKRWGNLSAEEMVRRVWEGAVAGTYVGHGEAIEDGAHRMFLGEGGSFKGQSVPRLAFFKKIIAETPLLDPIDKWQDRHLGGVPGRVYLRYFGNDAPREWNFVLPKEGLAPTASFFAEIIDTWNMQVMPLQERFVTRRLDDYSVTADRSIVLPGRPYQALRIRRLG